MATGDNDAQVFLMILVFLAAWTGFVGVINMASSGQISLGTLGSMTGEIPGQMNLNIDNSLSSQTSHPIYEQDYTNSTGYDGNITVMLGGSSLGAMWTQSDGVGYTCTAIPFYPLFQPAELGLIDVLPQNNIYDVTYTIDNSASVPNFYTFVWSVGTTNGLFIKYDGSDVYLMTLGPLGMSQPIQSFPAPGANQATIIQTQYDISQDTIDITIDGNFIGTFTNVPPPGVGFDYPGIAYGGVATYHTGLIVQKMYGIMSTVMNLSQNSGLQGLYDAFTSFTSLIAAAVGLSHSPVLPVGVWAVLGVPCIATLMYLGFKLIRG